MNTKIRYNLKVFRIRHNLTQSEMAQKMGISKSHYVSIERGTFNPSYKVLEKFTEVFNFEGDTWELFRMGE